MSNLHDNLVAFMAHIPLTRTDMKYVEKELLKDIVPNSKYLIVGEVSSTGIQHLHFLCWLIPSAYARFAKRVFIDHYKLQGRATKGVPRQYGKLKKVQSRERMAIYMMKDFMMTKKHLLRSNMAEDYLMTLATMSYKKKDIKTPYKKYIEVLPKFLYEKQYRDITLSNLIQAWLHICNCRPPYAKSMWWYAYQANVISQTDFIHLVYPTDPHDVYSVKNIFQYAQKPKAPPNQLGFKTLTQRLKKVQQVVSDHLKCEAPYDIPLGESGGNA